MKQKITKLFVLLLSVLLILPSMSQAAITYTNLSSSLNPLIGNISQSYLNDSNKDVVIFIQDMHSNPTIQKNIYKTIDFINNNYGINKILIEGAPFTKLDTSLITTLKNYNSKISDYLLNKGMLTGTEYFILKNNAHNIDIYGLEDWNTYIENIKELAKINQNLESSKKVFENFYNLVIERTNSKKLLKYINLNFSNNKLLSKINQPILKYDTLYKYTTFSDTKKKFNEKAIKKEHLEFLNTLKSSLDYESYSKIINESHNKDLVSYWNLLSAQFSQKEEYKQNFKNLYSYLNYLSQLNALNIVSLIYQQNEYFNDFLKYIYTTSPKLEEKIFILKMTDLFERIVNLSITEYEYKFFINNFDRYQSLLSTYLTKTELNKFEPLFKFNKYLDYYNANELRNTIFVKNLLSSIKNKEHSNNSNVTVVVAGGFHSSILNTLKEKDIQYILLTPYSNSNTFTNAYSKIVASTFDAQMLAPIPMLLAKTSLVPEHTRQLFLSELVEAFASVYNDDPEKVKEVITNFVRENWAEPLSIHIKDDTFNIFIGKEALSFKIKNNRIDFSQSTISLIEKDTIFIRDFDEKPTIEYEISINDEAFIFEIEEDIASTLTLDDIQAIIDEVTLRTGQSDVNISHITNDNERTYPRRIAIKTFDKSNSSDLFINNILESNTFFINKALLKTDPSVKKLFLEISIIHSILFSFFDIDAFDKNLLSDEDIRFVLINMDEDAFGLPNIEKLKNAIEAEFSKKEVRVVSQLKKYSGNIEYIIDEVLAKDYLGEYRQPHWKHIIREYFTRSKNESNRAKRKMNAIQKKFFSSLVVDNSDKESFQEFLDRRVSLDRQEQIKTNISKLVQHLRESISPKDKQYEEEIIASFEKNISDCLELMYKKMPRHLFEKFVNEKGMVSDHNFNHSLKLLEFAIDIVNKENNSFRNVDFTVLVHAAFMHDISCIFFRDNHVNNSAIWAKEILRTTDMPERTQNRIVASCLAHEKILDKGERVEHKIYEARLIHDADGLSAVMALDRIMNIWLKSKEPFFVKERTDDERLDLIEQDKFLYTDGGDTINDLMRQFLRMKPSRYLTKGAQNIVSSAMEKGQDLLISLLLNYKEKIFDTFDTFTEEDFNDAIETIKRMFKNEKFIEIMTRGNKKVEKEQSHDDVFDFSKDISTDNTLLLDIVDSKEELYRLEKAERLGVNTLAITFSNDDVLSDIPLTNTINVEKVELEINGQTYFVTININLIKLDSFYSDYMKVLTIDVPNLPEELKSEIIKRIRDQIVNNKQYSEYIAPLENITILNFNQANDTYETLTTKKVLSDSFAKILVEVWNNIPILYDLRTEKSLIIDSNEFIKIDNINAILSAS